MGSGYRITQNGANQSDKPTVVDRDSWYQCAIEAEHAELHAGIYYSAFVISADFDGQSQMNIVMQAPSTTDRIHAFFVASCTTFAQFDILEGPTIDGGVIFVPRNHRRDGAPASGVIDPVDGVTANRVRINSTINADGLVLRSEMLGAARSQGGDVSATHGEKEWLMNPGTIYAARIAGTGTGADNQIATLIAGWYEVEAKIN